ncbi:MAG TPA: uracil-DNA glycosylase [Oligoflexia bacterium]|nr:uracil-DNA glycosylase [Oligoflexia bacterium]
MTEKNAHLSQQQKEQMKEHLKRTYGEDAIVSKRALTRRIAGASKARQFSSTALRPTVAAPPLASVGNAVDALPIDLKQPALNETLQEIKKDLGDCTRCKLCKTRTNIVFGEGNEKAKIMFVGEGPGETEDLNARPFVGRAGQLLDKIIEAMGYKREDVYIANVVKCRPPGNRVPEPQEVATCEPFLFRQIDVIKPSVVVALGGTALQSLLHSDAKISKMRGKFVDYRGTKLMPTYHPAFLLRNPSAKKDVWDDMKVVLELLKKESA